VFCAGLDITEFYNPNPDRLAKFWTTLQDTWLALYLAPFPTAAVINVTLLNLHYLMASYNFIVKNINDKKSLKYSYSHFKHILF